jgi:hypothetical protein
MNISEAIHTQTLLAWITNPAAPDFTGPGEADVEGMAVTAARFLAERARTALGAGPSADETEAHLLAALRGRRDDS